NADASALPLLTWKKAAIESGSSMLMSESSPEIHQTSRTHLKVSYVLMRKVYTPVSAAVGVEEVLGRLEGRWKLLILFHLFDGKAQRYSDLEKLIPGI